MTEHQIKGCQTLAEVEGIKPITLDALFCSDKNGKACTRNYLHDWNDLHRVWGIVGEKIRSTNDPLEYMDIIPRLMGINSKKMTFNALVEAAEWIKQQEK